MSMAELVAAGAPELPEGYFYRIRPTHITSGYFVGVRRQRRFLGSEELSCTVVYPSHFDNGGEAIVDGCRRAFENWSARDTERERCGEAGRFLGDHDPRGGR
ncbi:hypothetical protein [Streptomyces sp. NBC_01212]|uniref:hypothetical protein n=1 Tax=Streptomyces sp. NBC_01212 TaxID=2903775 RepID=UPI002E111516|nr:DUF5458 family protein [Streptomyces sp. NBC_01212]